VPGRTATGIVLAGGRSSRFGRDKLGVLVDGVPLLHHALRALAPVCGEIVLVGPVDGLRVPLPRELPVPLVLAADAVAYGGPLVGLHAGARRAAFPVLVVAGADMPGLRPDVLRLLLDRPAAGGPVRAVALESQGRVQSLPFVVDRVAAIGAAGALLDAGRRSLRELLEALDVLLIPEAGWRELDPDGETLRDVDTPGDLRGPGSALPPAP